MRPSRREAPLAIAAAEATADAAGPRARTRDRRDRRDRARILVGPEPHEPATTTRAPALTSSELGVPGAGERGGRGDLGFSGALALKSAPRGGRAELRPAP